METIRFKLIKDTPAGKKGTIKEWPAKHAGIIRALVSEGTAKKLPVKAEKVEGGVPDPELKEKVEKPAAKKEKVESKTPRTKPAKKK